MQERTRLRRLSDTGMRVAALALAASVCACGVGRKVSEERHVQAASPVPLLEVAEHRHVQASSPAPAPDAAEQPGVQASSPVPGLQAAEHPRVQAPPPVPVQEVGEHRRIQVAPPEPVPEVADPARVPRLNPSESPDDLPTTEEANGAFHVVLPGETLWSISREYGHTVESLVEANALPDENRIDAGQQLFIPGVLRLATLPSGGETLEWPVPGREILSRFGVPRRTHVHQGLDVRGRRGDPVTASEDGTVTYSGWMRGYGRTVILDHGDGLETLYAHNRDLLVQVGEPVSRGQVIASVGRTGNATTAHCHFEVRIDGVAVDPLVYLFTELAERR